MISVFKKQSPIQPSGPHGPGDGSETAPWNWYDIAEGENITDGTILRRDASGAFVRVNLTAGVSYEIFADNSANDSYIMVFYEDDNGNMSNAKDDDEDPGWDCDYENDSCEYSVRFTFTPDTTGNYIIKYIDYYAQWDGSDNICGFDSAYIKPAPNVVQTANPDEPPSLIYPTSEGFNSLGKPIEYRSAVDAGCAVDKLKDNDTLFLFEASRIAEVINGIEPQLNGTVTRSGKVANFNHGYLTFATQDISELDFGESDDFTVEYMSSTDALKSNYPSVIANKSNWTTGTFCGIRYGNNRNAGNGYRVFWNPGDPLITESTATSTWGPDIYRHQACVRQGGVVKMFIDGKFSGSAERSIPADFSKGIWLGCGLWDGEEGYFYGNLLWLRISRGARYTGEFTPPTYFYKK